ncbi:two-component system phosphate regulon sensor histidine kinase PhoR [Gracilibacillus halotolerans]|uniref:histidine kinase n=1 Tax=Gracilibacillus halotolerans TaxID=74386 RepID=A0A841RI74_9BACI|nr:HAMP domain-containing sensor histidine kinase [Gracilibacillus halotolerans]MBB6513900.1 two-component system phosphate regulon sensor histidine kinase PhoR [Gracilibacillus halotolerans]
MDGKRDTRLFTRYIVLITIVFLFLGAVIAPLLTLEERILIMTAVVIAYFIVLILTYNIFENYVKPIKAAAIATNELAKGNYKVRTYVKSYGEAHDLSNAINQLARDLQEIVIHEKIQGIQWETVINNMESGIMLIDERGYVHLVNRKIKDIFSRDTNKLLGYLYYEIIEDPGVQRVVQETFLYEEKVTGQFTHTSHSYPHYYEVTSAPVMSEKQELEGVVLVFHDITELKRVEKMRKDFVANVSHELKTPITSIRGFAETLLEEVPNNKEINNQFLTIIFNESKRLQALIDDLLELTKLEREGIQLNYEHFHIDEWIETPLKVIKDQAEKKKIHLYTEIQPNLSYYGDPDRLQQVLLNLAINATNYTPEDGEVRILIHKKETYLEWKIEDTGIGIPQEEQSRIFERFYRVDRARSRNTGGTGLGLAIVKHIVESHEGDIRVFSEVNKGTEFIIQLPILHDR